MDLTREAICMTLSPSKLYQHWRLAHYTSSAWRIQCLRFAGLVIAVSFHQQTAAAISCYAVAAVFLSLYHIPLNDMHYLLTELPRSGLMEIQRLNARTIRIIAQHSTSKSFKQRGAIGLMQIEHIRSLRTMLDRGPFAIQMPQDPNELDRQIMERLEILHDVNGTFQQMLQEFLWLKQLEKQFTIFAKRYHALLMNFPFIPPDNLTKALNETVNNYATLVIQAATHPYEPFNLAA